MEAANWRLSVIQNLEIFVSGCEDAWYAGLDCPTCVVGGLRPAVRSDIRHVIKSIGGLVGCIWVCAPTCGWRAAPAALVSEGSRTAGARLWAMTAHDGFAAHM